MCHSKGTHEFVHVHTTHVDLDTAVSKSPITITKVAVSLMIPRLLGLSWKADVVWILMKPMTAVVTTTPDATPDATPAEISSFEDVKTSPGPKALELPFERSLEEVPTETEDEQTIQTRTS